MKRQMLNRWSLVGLTALVVIAPMENVSSQEVDKKKKLREAPVKVWSDEPWAAPPGGPTFNLHVDPKHPTVHLRESPFSPPKLREAAESLRDAESDDAKEKAEDKLRELLNEYFDADMERRVQALKEMEDRLARLREQLARRGDKKSEIIDLQVQVLVNEAEGLGFYSNASPSGLSPAGFAPRIVREERVIQVPVPAAPAAPAEAAAPSDLFEVPQPSRSPERAR